MNSYTTNEFSYASVAPAILRNAKDNFRKDYDKVARRTDRMFMWLLLAQWVAATGVALWISPLAWTGRVSVIHGHVYAALVLGGVITSLPVYMVLRHPGTVATRYIVACAQLLWSGLLIHLSGGRIETHFHIFGSLALVAFYRDLKVMIPATLIVALDHFLRGLFWPESIYGLLNPEWWRFLEHVGWVAFIDLFLIIDCIQSRRELQDLSLRGAMLRSSARAETLRLERLAAVGQLAASVGHELRNPLAAIRNAHTYLERKIAKAGGDHLQLDDRSRRFMGLITRELDACTKIISNLLDFSRPREPQVSLCPLRPLVAEAIELVPEREGVVIVNDVPDQLPIPEVDRDLFRQILLNLVQNGCEAIGDAGGTVTVVANHLEGEGWRISVHDDGPGIPEEHLQEIFKPLFSTKTKGTGLGLAVASGIVERHGGHLKVTSVVSKGATFTIALPDQPMTAHAAE